MTPRLPAPNHSPTTRALRWALDEARRLHYRPVDAMVLITLAMSWNVGLGRWPSIAQLAADAGCTERQAQRALARFRKDGLIGSPRLPHPTPAPEGETP